MMTMNISFLLIQSMLMIAEVLTAPLQPNGELEKGQDFIITSELLLKNIDETVDPCKDFYNFACGQYVKRNRKIPDDEFIVSYWQDIQDYINRQMRVLLEQESLENETHTMKVTKNFYKSCMNSDIQPLKTLLAELGGWPVVEGWTWDATRFSITKALLKYQKLKMISNYWFNISIPQNAKSQGLTIIEMNQPLWSVRYHTSAAKVEDAVMLGANPYLAYNEIDDMTVLGLELDNIVEDKINETLRSYTIQEWQELIPNITWIELFSNLLPPNNDEVKIRITAKPLYFQELSILLKMIDMRTWSNLMLWYFVSEFAEKLSEDFRQLHFDYANKYINSGLVTMQPRWKYCVQYVSEKLPYGYGSMYVRNYYNKNIKPNATMYLSYLHKSFRSILHSSTWMGEEKWNALTKLNSMKFNISFQEEFLNDSYLDELHKNVLIDAPSFLANIIRADEFPSAKDYFWNPADANAFYFAKINTLAIPLGFIQGINFNSGNPKYANFAGLGNILGHEISHGFDNTGMKFDGQGNRANWWKNETLAKFKEKLSCLINQYNRYAIPNDLLQFKMPGELTEGDNIADSGGIKAAYLAYQLWVHDNHPEPGLPGLPYNSNQLFWISYAQKFCTRARKEFWNFIVSIGDHAINSFRVLGPLSNSPEFAKDFSCQLGSWMNPTDKCDFW